VFGPGYGESIVLHTGDNEWVIVDSCAPAGTREPAGLTYLSSLGVDVAVAVKLIVATHWHDDHVRGLATTLDACANARFACSEALSTKEFLTVVKAFARRPMSVTGSGVQELDGVIRCLDKRAQASGLQTYSPKWASAGKLLSRRVVAESVVGVDCEIHSLSPSEVSSLIAKSELADLLPNESVPKRRLLSMTPNHSAVVLWVRAGNHSVLLGSDLEDTSDPNRGWKVILDSDTRPFGEASVFKVAHHGSANGDHERIWRDLLADEPCAVLTPFIKGNVKLPTVDDISRICSCTPNAYATASPNVRRRSRDKVVKRILEGAVRNMQPIETDMGHVRLRIKNSATSDPWNVELFGAATGLHRLAA
jgi:hypothetical protein